MLVSFHEFTCYAAWESFLLYICCCLYSTAFGNFFGTSATALATALDLFV